MGLGGKIFWLSLPALNFIELCRKLFLICFRFSYCLCILYIPGLIDYNFLCFRQAIQEVFDLRRDGQLALAHNEVMVNGVLEHPML